MRLSLLDRSLQRILRRRARRKIAAARDFIGPSDRVLDIGAAEGWVAEQAATAAGLTIALDRRPSRRAAIPFVVADAARLPFASDAFDVGLLCYVLHHVADPDAVMREALRVCRRVIVWESLFVTAAGRRLLAFLDRHANAMRGLKGEPLNLDSAEGWIARFRSAGASLVHRHVLGRFVHRHELFVFERASLS